VRPSRGRSPAYFAEEAISVIEEDETIEEAKVRLG
jgi:hypothetical protein